MRLIQQRGISHQALYTLRARAELSSAQSIYTYDTLAGTVQQRARGADRSSYVSLEPSALVPLLHGVLLQPR